MKNNLARRIQQILNIFSHEKKKFYAWMDSEQGWENYFRSFDCEIISSKDMVSRYNIYYWAKFLRSRKKNKSYSAGRLLT